MGLQGMINDLVEKSDFLVGEEVPGKIDALAEADHATIARWISAAENCGEQHAKEIELITAKAETIKTPILGITGGAEQERAQWSTSWFVALLWISMISELR